MQGMSDSFNDTPRPQLNYSMLAQQQQTANTMFEQQVQSSKSDYSAALNLDVTSQAAKELKAGYIAEAQKKLREVATQDLLLPKTAAQAKQVFEPFWSDERLLLDSGHTKSMNSGISKVQRGMLSTDDDERKMYDMSQIQYLQGTQLELERAGTDLNKLRAIRKRGIVPVRNVMDFLRQAAADQKMTVEIDQPTGGYYLKSTIGGPDSVPNFTTFAAGILNDPSWKQQFEMYGQIDVDNRKRMLLSENPNLTDEELTAMVPKDLVKDMDNMFTSQMSNVAVNIKTLEEQKQKILQRQKEQVLSNGTKTKVLLDSDVDDLESIERSLRIASYTDITLRNKKEQWDTEKVRNQEYIYKNPAQYLGDIQKQRSIEAFAGVMASSEKLSFKVDPAYKEMQDNKLAQAIYRETVRNNTLDYDIADRRLGIDNTKNMIDAAKEGLITFPNQQQRLESMFGAGVLPGSFGSDGLTYVPQPTSTREEDIASIYEEGKTSTILQNNEATYGVTNGVGRFLVGQSGTLGTVEVNDMSLVRDAMGKKTLDASYVYTTAEEQALKKVGALVGLQETNTAPAPGFIDLGETKQLSRPKQPYKDPAAMYAAVKDYMTKKSAGGLKKGQGDLGTSALYEFEAIDRRMQKMNELDNFYKEAVQKKIDSNPEYAVLNLKPKDIEKEVPAMEFVEPSSGKVIKMSSKEVAEKLLSGALQFREPEQLGKHTSGIFSTSDPDATLNGMSLSLRRVDAPVNSDVHQDYDALGDLARLRGIQYSEQDQGLVGHNRTDVANAAYSYLKNSKAGDLTVLGKKRKEATKTIFEENPVIRDLSGSMGRVANIPGSSPLTLSTMAAVTLAEGNTGYYTADGKPIDQPADMNALKTLLNTRDETGKKSKYISYIEHETTGGIGSDAIVVHFKPYNTDGTEKLSVEGKAMGDVLSNGAVKIHVDRGSKNPAIQKLIASKESMLYANYYKPGHKESASAVMQSTGFNVGLSSYASYGGAKATDIVLTGTYAVYNPKTGKNDIIKNIADSGISTHFSLTEKNASDVEAFWQSAWRQLNTMNEAALKADMARPQKGITADEVMKRANSQQ